MARIAVNSPGWEVQRPSRGAASPEAALLPGLPDEFLTPASIVDEEVVLQPRPTRDGAPPLARGRFELRSRTRRERRARRPASIRGADDSRTGSHGSPHARRPGHG